jgi:hypothetical protein
MFIFVTESFPSNVINVLNMLKNSNAIEPLIKEGITLIFTKDSSNYLDEDSLNQFMNVLPPQIKLNLSDVHNLPSTRVISLINNMQFISCLKIEAIVTLFEYSEKIDGMILKTLLNLLGNTAFFDAFINLTYRNETIALALLNEPEFIKQLTNTQWIKLTGSSAQVAEFIIKNYKAYFLKSYKKLKTSYSWLKDLNKEVAFILLKENDFVTKLHNFNFLTLTTSSVEAFQFTLENHRFRFKSDFLFSPRLYSESIIIELLSNSELLVELELNEDKEFLYFVLSSPKTAYVALSQPYKKDLIAALKNFDFSYLNNRRDYSSIIITLLQDLDFLEVLDNDQFTNLLISSEEIAQFAIKNEAVSNKLDNIEKELYSEHLGILPQTFVASCTACALLFILKMKGLISDEHCTRTKELEIYTEIWINPGKSANPQKTVDYLKKNGLNVMGIEFVERREKIYKEASDYRKHAFHLFQQATEYNYCRINSEDLNEIKLKEKDIFLLVEDEGDPNHHLVLCLADQTDGLNVIDPFNGMKVHYESFEDYLTEKKNFMGVAYKV